MHQNSKETSNEQRFLTVEEINEIMKQWPDKLTSPEQATLDRQLSHLLFSSPDINKLKSATPKTD